MSDSMRDDMKKKRKLLWVDKTAAWNSSNYIGIFDLTKGLIMVQIIIFHCINDYQNLLMLDGLKNTVTELLLSPLTFFRYAPVPMLFMICGYGIRRQPIKKNIKNHLKLFLPPYFFVILCVLLCVLGKQLLVGGSLAWRLRYQIVPFFFGLHPGQHFLGRGMEQIGPVWFFFTYTFGSIYLNLVLQERQKWIQILILCTGTVLALLFNWFPLPFCFQQIFICAGFMFVGMQLKNNKIHQKKLPAYLVILSVVLCIIISAMGGLVEYGSNVYRLGGVELITGYIAGIILLCLYQRLNVLQGVLADGLRWIGRHMMWFCCVHTITYLVVPWDKVKAFFGEWIWVGLLLECTVSLVYAVVACMLIEAGLKWLRMRKKKSRRNVV